MTLKGVREGASAGGCLDLNGNHGKVKDSLGPPGRFGGSDGSKITAASGNLEELNNLIRIE